MDGRCCHRLHPFLKAGKNACVDEQSRPLKGHGIRHGTVERGSILIATDANRTLTKSGLLSKQVSHNIPAKLVTALQSCNMPIPKYLQPFVQHQSGFGKVITGARLWEKAAAAAKRSLSEQF